MEEVELQDTSSEARVKARLEVRANAAGHRKMGRVRKGKEETLFPLEKG